MSNSRTPFEVPYLWALIKEVGGPAAIVIVVAFIVRLDATATQTKNDLTELRAQVAAWQRDQRDLESTSIRNTTRIEALERQAADDTHVYQAGRAR